MSKTEKEAARNIKAELAECDDFKEMYDRCFNNWYRHDFLRKAPSTNPCDPQYEDYRACFLEKLDKAGLRHLTEFDPKFEAESKKL